MVLLAQSPRFDAAVAQIAREFRREAVQRQDALWLHQLDVAPQIIVIGVIGKRKSGIDLVAVDGVRLDCPTADHRDALVR